MGSIVSAETWDAWLDRMLPQPPVMPPSYAQDYARARALEILHDQQRRYMAEMEKVQRYCAQHLGGR